MINNMNDKINPRITTELHGNLPDDFKLLENKIFYRESYTEFATLIWIPKSSIVDCKDEEIMSLPIYKSLCSAFEKNPTFESIILSNC
jgi:hypothetical protein